MISQFDFQFSTLITKNYYFCTYKIGFQDYFPKIKRVGIINSHRTMILLSELQELQIKQTIINT